MDYTELNNEIKSNIIRPVYLLSGEEDWLIRQLVQDLIKAVINPAAKEVDLVQIDVGHQPQTLDFDRLEQEIMTPPFLSEQKLIILKNTDLFVSAKGAAKTKIDETRSRLKDLLLNFPSNTVLLFVEEKANRSQKSFLAALEKANGVFAEIGLQDSKVLQAWIRGGAAKHNLTIEKDAVISLIERCDSQMAGIRAEMEKLFLYLGWSGGGNIDLQIVELVCRPDSRSSIFDLTDALSEGNAQRALEVLGLLLQRKEPVQLILFMLYRHIRQLLQVQGGLSGQKIAARMKISPYIAGKLRMQAQRFSQLRLASIYEMMFQTDLQIKKGEINDLLGLELLIIEAASK